jgi:hypothetical protein
LNGSADRSLEAAPRGRSRIAAELAAIFYIAIIAQIAALTGAFYLMFPELGALSHDVLTRPRGAWARAPVALIVTPAVAAIIGIFFTRALPYGFASVMLTIGGAVIVILAMRSPIAPAISAGLLPLVLGIKSWWYPPGILFGSVLLAVGAGVWNRIERRNFGDRVFEAADTYEDALELAPSGARWMGAFAIFVALAMFAVEATGLRFILFPPLVVIGYEMLGHPAVCPWARRPLALPVACFLTASGGLLCVRLLGADAAAAGLAMAWGLIVLRYFDLHIPPALAIALLPMVMNHPTLWYAVSVAIGTAMLTVWFLTYGVIFDATAVGVLRAKKIAAQSLVGRWYPP